MKRRPNARDVLEPDGVGVRVHKLKVELCSCGGKRSLNPRQHCFGTHIHKAVAVSYVKAVAVQFYKLTGKDAGEYKVTYTSTVTYSKK